MKKAKKFKCATIAIVGRPNAGKSTLLNAILETPLSATSKRPQTTRSNIRGIIQRYNAKKEWKAQLILIDTPGVNFKKGLLDRSMHSSVEGALKGVDIVLWVADSRSFKKDLLDLEKGRPGSDKIPAWLEHQLKNKAENTEWILVLNKVDAVAKNELLPLMDRIQKLNLGFSEMVPVSALGGLKDPKSNISYFLDQLENKAPESIPLFSENEWTDLNDKGLIQNLVREALFRQGREELPYETDCSIERFIEPEGNKRMSEVDATIWAAKPSLKPIIVGARGSRIKEIGFAVRARYKEITGQDLVLRLFVKVVEKWQEKSANLQELGYDQY